MRDRKQLGKLFWRTLIQNFVLMKGEWIDHVTKLWISDLPKDQSYGIPKQLYMIRSQLRLVALVSFAVLDS